MTHLHALWGTLFALLAVAVLLASIARRQQTQIDELREGINDAQFECQMLGVDLGAHEELHHWEWRQAHGIPEPTP